MHYSIGLEAILRTALFAALGLLCFRKRPTKSATKECNERIIRHGLNIVQYAEQHDEDESDNSSRTASGGGQQIPGH
jgi:hypothetical protein